MAKRESKFQKELIDELKTIFDGCIVLKNDAGYRQGIPDLLLLWGPHWAVLEVKRDSRASIQPNQEWYVDRMNEMSYGSFVCPETKDRVIDEIKQAFEFGGAARFSKR